MKLFIIIYKYYSMSSAKPGGKKIRRGKNVQQEDSKNPYSNKLLSLW